MATFQEIADGKYVSLTTFKKDGTPVATPLWGARDGDRLLVWTTTDSWKVKRIKRNAKVTVAPCTARGKVEGAAVDGVAEILDAAGTEQARAAIASKYGILGWLTVKGSSLRRGKSGTVGISVVPS
ncbi:MULTISPECIES: PPOX class F420-dependent oxidoreductase [Nocardiaceae]|jgi:PPOX class probable F420-dependent enzyme|uniref:PPOX class F420-dependent oxidoreductase n=1 Tax=Nocardiaceae TaxID=85025 RepID=UPI000361F189|nr:MULTISPECIES: PPOX class F420-dependent oxidoreductase [Rhodococcus]OZC46169.1 PPOX class F420-dependent oxidoreductase [Rhodococcus sp. RS1C4]OZC53821.1 PPOX class F420-dependent oxidoreductase [Rhodococcus sp. 06-621-2]OZC89221.1 PPOX class F420-dependent oxidoreductase [Rhodococcus sp. 06-418-1B]OZD05401.1 PPOX class F420-dependent oxidoreductase [Rhodococcus sp. 06-156-4C]OZD16513.1 PPOX class F420-dependent oxidoreductase [Rhodococcus sp. 06-156-4a]